MNAVQVLPVILIGAPIFGHGNRTLKYYNRNFVFHSFGRSLKLIYMPLYCNKTGHAALEKNYSSVKLIVFRIVKVDSTCFCLSFCWVLGILQPFTSGLPRKCTGPPAQKELENEVYKHSGKTKTFFKYSLPLLLCTPKLSRVCQYLQHFNPENLEIKQHHIQMLLMLQPASWSRSLVLS